MLVKNAVYACDAPGVVAISVLGPLDPRLAERLGGMSLVPVEGDGETRLTLLIGTIVDQSALVGLINTLHNLAIPILSVQRLNA